MSYAIGTIMAGPDVVTATNDFNNAAKPMVAEAGATEVTGWQAMSGQMTGSYVMVSRWTSLDTADAWMAESAKQAAAGGDVGELMSRYQVVARGMFEELAQAGTPTGAYMVVSRFSMAAAPVGLDYAADLTVESGANGAIISHAFSFGEFSGQLTGSTFFDSIDQAAATVKTVGSDAQFIANAVAFGAKLESRTIFRSL